MGPCWCLLPGIRYVSARPAHVLELVCAPAAGKISGEGWFTAEVDTYLCVLRRVPSMYHGQGQNACDAAQIYCVQLSAWPAELSQPVAALPGQSHWISSLWLHAASRAELFLHRGRADGCHALAPDNGVAVHLLLHDCAGAFPADSASLTRASALPAHLRWSMSDIPSLWLCPKPAQPSFCTLPAGAARSAGSTPAVPPTSPSPRGLSPLAAGLLSPASASPSRCSAGHCALPADASVGCCSNPNPELTSGPHPT